MTERAPRGEGGYQFQKHRGSRYTQDRHTNNRVDRTNSLHRTEPTHTAVTDARGAQVSRYLHKSRIRGLIMTLSLCLVPLYSRSLPAPAPALPVRQRGAASSAKNGATDSNDPSLGRRAPKTVPPIQMTPQLGGTVLCAGPHEILERPSHRRCKRARRGTLQILLHAPCKGPARRGRRLRRTAREQPESILHHLALLMPVPITLHAPAAVVAPLPSHPWNE